MSKQIKHAAIEDIRSFELKQELQRIRSERRAWYVAGFMSILSLVLALGYWWVMPLKTETPYVVVVDTLTGSSSVSRLDMASGESSISQNDAVNKSNIARFIIAKESYDWGAPNKSNWKTVFAMATDPVANQFKQVFAANNPDNPDTVWAKDSIIKIKLKSIVLTGKDATNNQTPTGAFVRFDRWIIDRQTQQEKKLDSKVATLDFSYEPNLKMPDSIRLENPLGFQVLRYSVDSDMSEEIVNTPSTAVTKPAQTPQANSLNSPAATEQTQQTEAKP